MIPSNTEGITLFSSSRLGIIQNAEDNQDTAKQDLNLCSQIVFLFSQLPTAQILIVPSVPQDTSRFPSGLNATPEMLAVRGLAGG